MALNRDTGEFGLNSIYDNLSKPDRVKFNSPNAINIFQSVTSFNANEPDLRRSKRHFRFALKRIKLLNTWDLLPRYYFICLICKNILNFDLNI